MIKNRKSFIQIALVLIGCFAFYKGFSSKASWQGLHVLGYFIIASSCIIGIVWLEIKKK